MSSEFSEIGFALRRRFDAATGGVKRAAVRLADQIDWSNCTDGRPVVLCLDRALFRKDVAALRGRTRFNYASVSAKRLRLAQESWVAPKWRVQTYFTGYLERELAAVKPLLEEFGVEFLKRAGVRGDIDAVLSGNMDYWQDDALKLACKRLGIPFFVLCRENYVWEAGVQDMRARIMDSRYRFCGAGVAVASEATYRSLSTSGGFAEGVLRVTGFPRFDEWVGLPPVSDDARRSITLFCYTDPLYLAQQNFTDALDVFIAAAERHGERFDFVIKLKKPNEVEPLMERFPRLRGKRIRLTADQSVVDLARSSRVVIGYNSLVILESLLAEVAIVVPWWNDSVRTPLETIMHAEREFDRRHAYFPESPDALAALLDQAANGVLPARGTHRSRIERFSEQSLFSEDRSASELVEAMLLSRPAQPVPGAPADSAIIHPTAAPQAR